MNVIIYQDSDGLAVIHPAEGVDIETLVEMVPEGAPYIIAPADNLPDDRYFRDAWELCDGQLSVNVGCAKEVQRNRWRKMRKPKLEKLDLDFMRAIEAGDDEKKTEISEAKQALRDVTETELPDEIEAIKTTIPTILL
jgi:hypothetical protein